MATTPTSPPSPRVVLTMVFVVGAASLGTEIAAARLLAPWFGASTVIWANTIATVLVALSAGYWLGGRIADRGATLAGLARLILIAAVLLAVVPFVSGPFLRDSVDAFDSLSVGAFVGSLVAVLRPDRRAGAAARYDLALRDATHASTTVEEAGRVSGRLYAISTLGSLAGVFLAALLLVPVRRHAADLPDLRRRARAGGAGRALAGATRWCRSACVALLAVPDGDAQGDRGRPGDLGERDRVPVRARGRAPRRRAAGWS